LILGLNGVPIMTYFNDIVISDATTILNQIFFSVADYYVTDMNINVTVSSTDDSVINASTPNVIQDCSIDKSQCILQFIRSLTDPLGETLISVTAFSDSLNVTQSFTILVEDFPVISTLNNIVIYDDIYSVPVLFSVIDLDHPGDLIKLTVTTSNNRVIPDVNISCNGNKTICILAIMRSASSPAGQSLITITAIDPVGGTGEESFVVTVINSASPLPRGACCANDTFDPEFMCTDIYEELCPGHWIGGGVLCSSVLSDCPGSGTSEVAGGDGDGDGDGATAGIVIGVIFGVCLLIIIIVALIIAILFLARLISRRRTLHKVDMDDF